VYLSFFSIQFLHDLASTRILPQGHVNAAHPPHVPLLSDLGERGRGERAVLKKDVDMALG
jgi:hypothetical protein